MSIVPRIKSIKSIRTIGVKSNAPKRVGIYFLTNSYNGSSILLINFGRNLVQNKKSQDKSTSTKIMYWSISSKTIIERKIVFIIVSLYK